MREISDRIVAAPSWSPVVTIHFGDSRSLKKAMRESIMATVMTASTPRRYRQPFSRGMSTSPRSEVMTAPMEKKTESAVSM